MKKILLTFFLNVLVTLAVFGFLIYYAQNAYPASALYNLKRLYENAEMSLQFTDDAKAKYYLKLTDKRMAEIERVYNNEQYQHILITSLRYVATTGNATDFYLAKQLADPANELQKTMIEDVKRFEKMRADLPAENEDGRFLTDAINYTEANIQKLDQF